MNYNISILNGIQKLQILVQESGDLKNDAQEIQEGFESSWDKLLDRIMGWKDKFIDYLPEIVLAFLIFLVCYFVSIYLRKLINKNLGNSIQKTSVRSLISNVSSIIIIMVGLMIAISILNLGDVFNGLLAAGGIAGLAVGLALQGTLSNTFSGVFLSVNDMINVGDWIETNGYSGIVQEINLRNTRIKESDNNIVVIPNKTIIENPFKNYRLTNRIRTTIKCGVHYNSNLREVKEMAIKAIENKFKPLENEAIEFHWLEFGDSSINFQLRFWIEANKNVTKLEANSEAMMILKEVFDENNINIPFPIRTLEFADKKLPEIEFTPNQTIKNQDERKD